MKQGIHPTFYPDAVVVCGSCGTTWRTGSTKKEVHVDICSNCHPFFTGTQRIVDTAGQVERFTKRLQARESAATPTAEGHQSKKERRALERARRSGMLEATQPEPSKPEPAKAEGTEAERGAATEVAIGVGEAIGTAQAVVEEASKTLGEGVQAAAQNVEQAVRAVTGTRREPRRAPRPPRERKPREPRPAPPAPEAAAPAVAPEAPVIEMETPGRTAELESVEAPAPEAALPELTATESPLAEAGSVESPELETPPDSPAAEMATPETEAAPDSSPDKPESRGGDNAA